MPTVSSTCPMPATKKTRTTTDHEPRRSAPGHSSPVEPAGGWIGMISRCRDRTTGAAAGRAVGRADARSRAALKPAAAALLADCQLFGKGVMDSRPRGCGAAVVAEPECNRPLATMSRSVLSKAIAQHFQHLAGRLPRRGAIHLGRGERSARGSASSRGLLADVRGTGISDAFRRWARLPGTRRHREIVMDLGRVFSGCPPASILPSWRTLLGRLSSRGRPFSCRRGRFFRA